MYRIERTIRLYYDEGMYLLAMAKYKDLWRVGGATNRSAHEEAEGGATTRCAQGGPE